MAGAIAKSSARWRAKAAAQELPAHYAVPKAEGDGAVQAWIDLLPDWQTACSPRSCRRDTPGGYR